MFETFSELLRGITLPILRAYFKQGSDSIYGIIHQIIRTYACMWMRADIAATLTAVLGMRWQTAIVRVSKVLREEDENDILFE